jgi:sugar phosphate isomerase/epimerase
MRIGIDSYAYHRYFGEPTQWEQPLDARWTVFDFLARAVALGVGDVSLQTIFLPEPDEAFTARLRDQLLLDGLHPTLAWGHRNGLEGGTNPAKVEALRGWLPWAEALGCSLVRIVCGDQFTFRMPVDGRIERLTPILRDVTQEAAARGLSIAIENHADIRMRDLVRLVEQVGAPNLGICFCLGNSARVGDNPLDVVDIAAPWIRMVHMRDMILRDEWRGDPTGWWPAAPLGRGELDVAEFLRKLNAHGYGGCLFVEMANMYPDWPDEDAAVAESIAYLRENVDSVAR